MRVTYLINHYPLVSTTFIRREILALERQGCEIQRIAMRGWDTVVVDAEDEREQARTHYVLKNGPIPLFFASLLTMVSRPVRFLSALTLAVRIGWRAERPLPYHFIYLAEACRILKWVRSNRTTHVHTHFGTNAAEVAMLLRTLGGPPYSFTVHGPVEFDKPQFLGLGEKVMRSAFVVAITSYARSQIYRWVDHEYWGKIKVIHCGIEPAFYDIEQIKPTNTPKLVCVGRLSAEKGQLLLVEAAYRLAAKRMNFEIVLVGSGEMHDDIAALIKKYMLDKHVRMTGSISTEQLRKEILFARGLVVPSFAEGLPMVIMEAMALRRPVLTTDIAGVPELVQSGKNGWLIPAGSIDALTAAMEDFLSKPIDELKIMGESAYARVIERHSVDVQATKLKALYKMSFT